MQIKASVFFMFQKQRQDRHDQEDKKQDSSTSKTTVGYHRHLRKNNECGVADYFLNKEFTSGQPPTRSSTKLDQHGNHLLDISYPDRLCGEEIADRNNPQIALKSEIHLQNLVLKQRDNFKGSNYNTLTSNPKNADENNCAGEDTFVSDNQRNNSLAENSSDPGNVEVSSRFSNSISDFSQSENTHQNSVLLVNPLQNCKPLGGADYKYDADGSQIDPVLSKRGLNSIVTVDRNSNVEKSELVNHIRTTKTDILHANGSGTQTVCTKSNDSKGKSTGYDHSTYHAELQRLRNHLADIKYGRQNQIEFPHGNGGKLTETEYNTTAESKEVCAHAQQVNYGVLSLSSNFSSIDYHCRNCEDNDGNKSNDEDDTISISSCTSSNDSINTLDNDIDDLDNDDDDDCSSLEELRPIPLHLLFGQRDNDIHVQSRNITSTENRSIIPVSGLVLESNFSLDGYEHFEGQTKEDIPLETSTPREECNQLFLKNNDTHTNTSTTDYMNIIRSKDELEPNHESFSIDTIKSKYNTFTLDVVACGYPKEVKGQETSKQNIPRQNFPSNHSPNSCELEATTEEFSSILHAGVAFDSGSHKEPMERIRRKSFDLTKDKPRRKSKEFSVADGDADIGVVHRPEHGALSTTPKSKFWRRCKLVYEVLSFLTFSFF